MPVATHPWVWDIPDVLGLLRPCTASWASKRKPRSSHGNGHVTDQGWGEACNRPLRVTRAGARGGGTRSLLPSLQKVVQLFPAWLPSFPGGSQGRALGMPELDSPHGWGAEGALSPVGPSCRPVSTSVNHRWKLPPPPPPRSETGCNLAQHQKEKLCTGASPARAQSS